MHVWERRDIPILQMRRASRGRQFGQAHPSLKLTDLYREDIGILLPNNQRQHRTLHIQKDVLPDTLC